MIQIPVIIQCIHCGATLTSNMIINKNTVNFHVCLCSTCLDKIVKEEAVKFDVRKTN